MSNRLFQGVIQKMKDTVDRTIGVFDEGGMVIACSNLSKIGESREKERGELSFSGEVVKSGGYTYRYLSQTSKNDYGVFVEGEDEKAEMLSGILAVSFGNIKNIYDEKYDKSSFIKSVIFDNILPSDIYIKAKELKFSTDVCRVVMLLRFEDKKDFVPFDVVQNLFPYKNRDYVISISENEVVIVRELKDVPPLKELEEMAMEISDTITTEFFAKVFIGIGTVVETVKDLAKSYKESHVALEVGKIFDNEKNVMSYENLGIGRLIYQLPTTLCEMFLQEIFKKESIDSLDRETLITIQAFFENNLNVSETSRKLFVHRNTLVYRLEKIRKLTGLDLREFDNAITFKVALMVKKYLDSKPVKF